MPISKRKIIMIIILLVTPIIIYLINIQRTKYYKESFSDKYMVKEYMFEEIINHKDYVDEFHRNVEYGDLLTNSLIPDKKNLVRIKNYTKKNEDGTIYTIEVKSTEDEKTETDKSIPNDDLILFNAIIGKSTVTTDTIGIFRVVYIFDNKIKEWKPCFCTYGIENYINFMVDYFDKTPYIKMMSDSVFISSLNYPYNALNYPYNEIEGVNIKPTDEEKSLAKKAYLKSGGNKTYFDVMERERREGKEFSTLSRIKAQTLVDKDEKELTSIKIKQPKFQNIIQSNLSDDLK